MTTQTNFTQLNKAKNSKHNIFGLLIFCTIILSLQTLFLEPLIAFGNSFGSPDAATTIIIFIAFICAALYLMIFNIQLKQVGIHLENIKWVLIDSLKWTGLFIALMTALKIILIHTVNKYSTVPLFDIWQLKPNDYLGTWIFILAYIILCPIQELVARGIFQSGLTIFIKGRHSILISIIISNILFAFTHQHIGLMYCLVVFIPGLFWGWMFHRQQSLIGVSLSHIIIGIWATVIITFQNML